MSLIGANQAATELRSCGFSDYTDNDRQKVTLMVRCEG